MPRNPDTPGSFNRPTPRFRTIVRSVLRVAASAALGIVLLIGVLLLLLQFPFVAGPVARTVLGAANPWDETTAQVEGARGTWLTGLSLAGVRIWSADSSLVIGFDSLTTAYDLTALLNGELRFASIRLVRPVVITGTAAGGDLQFLQPFSRGLDPEPDTSEGLRVSGGSIEIVSGAFVMSSPAGSGLPMLDVSDILLAAKDVRIGKSISLTLDTMSAVYRTGQSGSDSMRVDIAGNMAGDLITVRSLQARSSRTRIRGSGSVALPFDTLFTAHPTSFRLVAEPVAYRDLHPFIPAFGPEGEAHVSALLTRDSLRAHARAAGSFGGGGSFEATATAEALQDLNASIHADLQTAGLSIAAITGDPDTTQRIAMRARISGSGRSPGSFAGLLATELDARGLVGARPLQASVEATLVEGSARVKGRGSLDALSFALEGRISAFSDPPTYDLAATLGIPHGARERQRDDILRKLEGLRATVKASGAGFNPLLGTSGVRLVAEWDDNPHMSSLEIEAASRDSVTTALAQLTTQEGRLRLDAQAKLGVEQEIMLRTLEFNSLDLSQLLGIQKSASLTGSATGIVRGADPSTMNGDFILRLDSSRAGTTHIGHGTLEVHARNGILTASVDAASSDGDIRLQAVGEPFAERPAVEIREARFRALDLGGILFGDDEATDLNGSASARLTMVPTPEDDPRTPAAAPPKQPHLTGTIQIDLAGSRIYRQDILGASLAAELAGQVAAVEIDLTTPEGGALLAGSVEPFGEFPDVRLTEGRFEHLNAGALAGIESLDTDITGTLSVDLQGASWKTAVGSAILHLHESRVNREPLDEARLSVELERGAVTFKGSSAMRAGTIGVDAAGSFGDELLEFTAGARVALHDLSRITLDSSLAGSGVRLDLTADGVWGDPSVTQVNARLRADGRLDSLSIDSLVTLVSVTGRTIRVDTLLVQSNAGTVRGAGTIAVFDTTGIAESDFEFTAALSSLDRLRDLAGVDLSRSGTARLAASLTGDGRAGALQFRTDVAGLAVEGVLIPDFRVVGSARLGIGPTFDGLQAQAIGTDLAVGEIVVDSVAATVNNDGAISEFRASLNLETGESLAVSGTAEELEDRYSVAIDSLSMNVGDRRWVLDHRTRVEIGDGLTVDDLSLSSGSRRISVHGVLDPEGEQNFVFQIDSLAFDRAARAIGKPGLGGNLTLSGLVTGQAHSPRATGRLVAGIESGGRPVGQLESDVDWSGGLLRVNSTITQPDRSQLRAGVTLPAALPFVSGSPAMATQIDSGSARLREFKLVTNGFDLKFLEPFLNVEAIPQARGMLTADIALTEHGGTIAGHGYLALDSGFVRVNSVGAEYSGIQLRASLQGSDFLIDTLLVRAGNGAMEASGTISLAALDDPVFDLLFRQSKFIALNTPTMRAVVDGSIEVAGTLSRPAITGEITIDESNFVIPETAGEGQVEAVVLTAADYEVLRERFGYRRPAPKSSSGADSMQLSLDVGLRFPRRSWIRKKANPSLSVEIEGDLRVRSVRGGTMNMIGTLRPVAGRSYVSQFGRQFEIKSGEIRFDGPPERFTMNVDSEYKVPARSGSGFSEATIRMQVERKLERFEFRLSSDPPMEQADILSYLTTGTATTGAFASTSSQGNIATSAALEQVVGAIGGLTEDKVPLDIFQIRQDGARGITIVAGNYVTPRTYLGIRYPILIQQATMDSYYDTGTEFEVEYQAVPWLFLNAKGGASRLLLLFKSRYAY